MNKTRRQVNLGNAAKWKTLTPCFSQCLKEIRLLRAHLWGTSWRKSMRLVTLMYVARKKSDRRLWIRLRAFQWRTNVQTQWEGDDTWVEGLQCALMDSRYTSTQNSCSNASLSHPMPLKTERRHSVSSCVASYPSGTTHSWRHTHAESTTESRSGERYLDTSAPDIARPTGEVQHVLGGGALLHRITWPHGLPTYQDICALYCDYLSRNFGPVIVVFDGYRIPSTKYTTH